MQTSRRIPFHCFRCRSGAKNSTSPVPSAYSNVAGFNESSLKGRSVIFQPWMNLGGKDTTGQYACWPYNLDGVNYQHVNYNGNGPYTPTRN
jgi:hypothetical protein